MSLLCRAAFLPGGHVGLLLDCAGLLAGVCFPAVSEYLAKHCVSFAGCSWAVLAEVGLGHRFLDNACQMIPQQPQPPPFLI